MTWIHLYSWDDGRHHLSWCNPKDTRLLVDAAIAGVQVDGEPEPFWQVLCKQSSRLTRTRLRRVVRICSYFYAFGFYSEYFSVRLWALGFEKGYLKSYCSTFEHLPIYKPVHVYEYQPLTDWHSGWLSHVVIKSCTMYISSQTSRNPPLPVATRHSPPLKKCMEFWRFRNIGFFTVLYCILIKIYCHFVTLSLVITVRLNTIR